MSTRGTPWEHDLDATPLTAPLFPEPPRDDNGPSRTEAACAYKPPKIERAAQPEGSPLMFWVGGHLVTLAEAADGSGRFPMLMLAPGAKWDDAAQTFAAWALDAEARATKAERERDLAIIDARAALSALGAEL